MSNIVLAYHPIVAFDVSVLYPLWKSFEKQHKRWCDYLNPPRTMIDVDCQGILQRLSARCDIVAWDRQDCDKVAVVNSCVILSTMFLCLKSTWYFYLLDKPCVTLLTDKMSLELWILHCVFSWVETVDPMVWYDEEQEALRKMTSLCNCFFHYCTLVNLCCSSTVFDYVWFKA